eukprot:3818391-Rhodomonas_salina.1
MFSPAAIYFGRGCEEKADPEPLATCDGSVERAAVVAAVQEQKGHTEPWLARRRTLCSRPPSA